MTATTHLIFRTEGERYALPSGDVDGVLDDADVQPLPWLSGAAVGVLRHGEDWLPVMDPACRLRPDAPARRRPATLLLRRGPYRFGLTVDEVVGRRELRARRLQPGEEPATLAVADEDAVTASGTGVDGLPPERPGEPTTRADLWDDDGPVTLLNPDELFEAEAPPTVERMEVDMDDIQGTLPIVTFTSGASRMGFTVDQVDEVLPWTAPEPLAGAPAFVRGTVVADGRTLPVLDARALFGLDAGAAAPPARRLLLVHTGGLDVALAVDDVSEVRDVPAHGLRQAPRFLSGTVVDYVDGVLELDERLVLLLRPDRLLSEEQREQLGRLLEKDDGDSA